MKKKRNPKLRKRIISFLLTLVIILTSINFPMRLSVPVLAELTEEISTVVKAADDETCPYSDSELSAATFD